MFPTTALIRIDKIMFFIYYHIKMNNVMDVFLNIINEIQTKMVSFLGEAWFANVISFIMGILGTFAFFMQVPRKIKPTVMQYGDIIFNVTEKKSLARPYIDLNSIELNLTISNLRNAVGIIEDLFVRVYTTDSYQPETVTYFATSITMDEKESDYTPFILSPNSHVSMKVRFGKVEHSRSEKIVTLENHYVLDIFYKIRGIRKPFSLNSILTYNKGKITDNRIELINLSMNIERDKYYKVQKKTYGSTYKGITNYFIVNRVHDIKYYVYYLPKRFFYGFFETLAYFFMFILTNIFAFFISRNIIIYEGKKFKKVRFSFGNKEHRIIKENTIKKLYSYIEKLVKEVNEGVKEENKIMFVTQQEDKFILSRFGEQLTVYSPGDSSIYAQVLEGENKINLRFEIKESKWGIKYWAYEGRLITQYNIAIKILNYFTLLTIVEK